MCCILTLLSVNFSGCIIGQGQDRGLCLASIKVIVRGIIEAVVIHDLMTLTQKMDFSRRGSVTGRGLMGDSASNGLVWSG